MEIEAVHSTARELVSKFLALLRLYIVSLFYFQYLRLCHLLLERSIIPCDNDALFSANILSVNVVSCSTEALHSGTMNLPSFLQY